MTVPAATPVTVPVVPDPATVAVPVALLLHVPPGVTSVRLMEAPVHTTELPEIAAGWGFTVTIDEAAQPVPESV